MFSFGKKCHVVGNNSCPFVFAHDLHEMPIVSEDVEGDGGRISWCLCMHDEDAEVCAERDEDGVQRFVLLEGSVVRGKLKSCTV